MISKKIKNVFLICLPFFLLISFFVFSDFLFGQAAQDVIGIRIYENHGNHDTIPLYINGILSPMAWYLDNVPNPGEPQIISINGYPAIQDGRSIYVAALDYDFKYENSDSDDKDYKINSYIYVISYNEGASEQTINIVTQLIDSWQFNVNIKDEEIRTQLRNDLQRVISINEIKTLLENFKKEHGFYPPLDAATYKRGWTYSVWPSWQKTFANQLGQELPVDPINEFNGCISQGTDPKTCWNETQAFFQCSVNSKVLAYNAVNKGNEYKIYANFEFIGPGNWQNAIDNLDNADCFAYETYGHADRDFDSILDADDICPDKDTKENLCESKFLFKYILAEELNENEICRVMTNRPDMCYQNRLDGECDTDIDGIGDDCDDCPLDKDNDIDNDGWCTGNSYKNNKLGGNDNCPNIPNPDQKNIDKNLELIKKGDACDFMTCQNNVIEGTEKCDMNAGVPENGYCYSDCSAWGCQFGWLKVNNSCIKDTDNDGVRDEEDNCIYVYNPQESNLDSDKYGDACDWCLNDKDNDIDNDGICANSGYMGKKVGDNDNCINQSNPQQLDMDNDFIGDLCDVCPDDRGNDVDNDGICEGKEFNFEKIGGNDNCPNTYNPEQKNNDNDLLGDACDNQVCGDGKITGQEKCDIGINEFNGTSKLNSYGCEQDCQKNLGWCGDGFVDSFYNEQCDKKNNIIDNNDLGCGADCQCQKPYFWLDNMCYRHCDEFLAKEIWQWPNADKNIPKNTFNQVQMTPVVSDIDNDNKKEIIFITFQANDFTQGGYIRIIDAMDSKLKATFSSFVNSSGEITVADINNDNKKEILTTTPANEVIAISASGGEVMAIKTNHAWQDKCIRFK